MIATSLAFVACAAGFAVAQCDPPAPPAPAILVSIKPVVRPIASGIDFQFGTPPQSFDLIDQGPFVVELWARQEDASLSGLQCVYADIAFNSALMTCDAVSPAADFADQASGACVPGGVDEVGGCTLTTGLGVSPEWRRIATIDMTAVAPATGVVAMAGQPSSTIRIMNCGPVPPSRVEFRGAPLFNIPCNAAAECSDGDLCNGVESCDGNGHCQPGAPVTCSIPTPVCDPQDGMCYECLDAAHCDDLDACTTNFCTVSRTCSFLVGVDCNDGSLCTEDLCQPATGSCVHTLRDCSDPIACTNDTCDPTTGLCVNEAPAPVNLVWRPSVVRDLVYTCDGSTSPGDAGQPCAPGEPAACSGNAADCKSAPFDLELYVLPVEPGAEVSVFGLQAVLTWEPERVVFTGASNDASPYPWLLSGFLNDVNFDNLNEGIDVVPLGVPFNDGDALYSAQGDFDPPVGIGPATVPPGGLLVATFTFVATDAISSVIDLVEAAGMFSRTEVLWGGQFECPTDGSPCNPNDTGTCGLSEMCTRVNPVSGCELQNLLGAARVLGQCDTVVDCGDLDADGVIGDVCFWFECADGQCGATERVVGDAGGAFGVCPPDMFANIHDRNHILTCFSGDNGCDALNADLGGPFGACPPDGFCNIHDANHVLTAFSGHNQCACPMDTHTATQLPVLQPVAVGDATLSVVASRREARPGSLVEVRVFLDSPLSSLQGYQLDLEVSGGRRGALELLDVSIDDDRAFVFTHQPATFVAFNARKAQMLAGLSRPEGVPTQARAYLATYTYRVSDAAAGAFVVDVRADWQTFLIASRNGRIEVASTSPSVVSVAAAEPERPANATTDRRKNRRGR